MAIMITQHAFLMFLKPGNAEEYRRRHDAIWPELVALLQRAGVSDYSIYLDENSHTLFAVQRRSSTGNGVDLVADPIMRRWWDYMADMMETNEDHSPRCVPLQLMFRLD